MEWKSIRVEKLWAGEQCGMASTEVVPLQEPGSWKGGLGLDWGGKDKLTSIKSSICQTKGSPPLSASPSHWFGWLERPEKTRTAKEPLSWSSTKVYTRGPEQ